MPALFISLYNYYVIERFHYGTVSTSEIISSYAITLHAHQSSQFHQFKFKNFVHVIDAGIPSLDLASSSLPVALNHSMTKENLITSMTILCRQFFPYYLSKWWYLPDNNRQQYTLQVNISLKHVPSFLNGNTCFLTASEGEKILL